MGLRPIPVKFQIAKETSMIASDTPLHHLTTTSARPRTRFMTAKTNTKFGFWNVRTLNQLTKPEQVLREMKKYKLDLLALSEVRWIGSGHEQLGEGYSLIYSGNESRHQAGVGIMLSDQATKALVEWKPVSERCLLARFVTNHLKISIIACYAPTNDADDTDKESFYQALQSLTSEVPSHDLLCVVGDFNAKVGAERDYCPQVLGRHGLGEMNENGALLVDYALSNDLMVGTTQFEHKTIHKQSWISPDGRTKNQIDHFLISRRWRTSLLDVRGFRGADAQSDHILMVAKLKVKLKVPKNAKSNTTELYDVDKLHV